MGPLTLPPSGPVYMDSMGIIYSVERIEPYCTLLDPLWRDATASQFTVVSSELAVSETLVIPIREGNARLETLFRDLFATGDFRLIPATRSLWEDTARLRALTGLKTPDALHAVTALSEECTLFVTNDPAFRRVPGLPVAVLAELL